MEEKNDNINNPDDQNLSGSMFGSNASMFEGGDDLSSSSMFNDDVTTEENDIKPEIQNETPDDASLDQEDSNIKEEIASKEIESEEEIPKETKPEEKIPETQDITTEQENKNTSDEEKINPIVSDEAYSATMNGSSELITVRPVKFQDFEEVGVNNIIKKNFDIMQDISMHVSVEIGKTKSTIREVMDLTKGSVIELNKVAGEQVEIYVNEKLVARGEVIVIEDRFGVRVTTTNIPKKLED